MRSATALLTLLFFSMAHAAVLVPAGGPVASSRGCSGMPCCAEKSSCAASIGCAAHRDGAAPGGSAGACLQAAACGHAAPGAVVPSLDPARIASAAPALAIPVASRLASPLALRPPSFAREPLSPPPRA